MSALIIRGIAYALLAVLLAQITLHDARSYPAWDSYAEIGPVELTQTALLVIAVVMSLLARSWERAPAALSQCMALVFGMLLVRENDQVLEMWLPHGVWKWPALLLLIWLGYTAWTKRQALIQSLKDLRGSTPLGVLLAGFSTLVFARLFGSGTFWEAVMEDKYWRPVKNAAEESVELFALGLIAAGAVEFYLYQKSRRVSDGAAES